MPDPPPTPRWLGVAAVALLGLVASVCFVQAAKNDYDFHHFYYDAAYVWQHGALNPDMDNPDRLKRRQLPFYLPVVPLLLAPLAAGGVLPAAICWTLLQTAAAWVCLRVLWTWRARVPTSVAGFVLAWAIALPAVYESARFNQLGLIILAMVLIAVRRIERGRAVSGGAWLALAAVIKLLPGLFVVWLVLKQRWRAVAAFVGFGALLAIVPCLLVFGPARTWAYHRQWWDYNVRGAALRGMTDTNLRHHLIDHRNQSLPAVIARLTEPDHPYRVPWQPVHLSHDVARRVGQAGLLLLGLGLVWITRRPWCRLAAGGNRKGGRPAGETPAPPLSGEVAARAPRGRSGDESAGETPAPPLSATSDRETVEKPGETLESAGGTPALPLSGDVAARAPRGRSGDESAGETPAPPLSGASAGSVGRADRGALSAPFDGPGVYGVRVEVALYLLAMLLLSPLLRTYYMVWAIPALVLLAPAALETEPSVRRVIGRVGCLAWLAGMIAWTSTTLRSYGVHWLILLIMAIVLWRLLADTDATSGGTAKRRGKAA